MHGERARMANSWPVCLSCASCPSQRIARHRSRLIIRKMARFSRRKSSPRPFFGVTPPRPPDSGGSTSRSATARPASSAISKGERLRIGEIDQRCVAANNELPKLTPREAASWTWKPDTGTWAAIKKRSVNRPATVTMPVFRTKLAKQPLSRGSVIIETSKDPVDAPIFYRDVPLMPAETEKGIIKPLDQSQIPAD